jgi:tetratricopeptide (TPR) repeat protein
MFAGLLKDLGQPVPANQKAQATKAQEFYLAALDAPTKSTARKLLEQALAFAPDHADANLALMDLKPVDPATRLERLRALVAAEAKQLGKKAFKEMAGHFWGFHETRPYMRLRETLAGELRAAGRLDEALVEYRELLELNPNDNQGLRYELLPGLLTLGRLEEVRALIQSYENDLKYSAVFAWCAVLERHLSADEPGALKALFAARGVNPHLEPYLSGRKRLPKALLPESYTLGSVEEAHCYVLTMAQAWFRHPESVAWLKAQS